MGTHADSVSLPTGWPHYKPRHGQVPGGGDVQGCQLWAAAGGAEVLGTEVDYQKLGQAHAALTPALPCALPRRELPICWVPALLHTFSSWDFATAVALFQDSRAPCALEADAWAWAPTRSAVLPEYIS